MALQKLTQALLIGLISCEKTPVNVYILTQIINVHVCLAHKYQAMQVIEELEDVVHVNSNFEVSWLETVIVMFERKPADQFQFNFNFVHSEKLCQAQRLKRKQKMTTWTKIHLLDRLDDDESE